MEPPDPYDLSEYNQELVKAQQKKAKEDMVNRDGSGNRNVPPWLLLRKQEEKNKAAVKTITNGAALDQPTTTNNEILMMQPKQIPKDAIKTAWDKLTGSGYPREKNQSNLDEIKRLLNKDYLHTVDLDTKDLSEDQKIWYIPDKQFETLVNEIKKIFKFPSQLDEIQLKRHRQERSDFKHGDGSKKSSISNFYKTYKPWGGKTKKTKGRKCRKTRRTRRTKCKKMKRRKTRK
jgi:hypothetical protein